MSEFVTNMFQYNVTVGITRSEVIFMILYEQTIRPRKCMVHNSKWPRICSIGSVAGCAYDILNKIQKCDVQSFPPLQLPALCSIICWYRISQKSKINSGVIMCYPQQHTIYSHSFQTRLTSPNHCTGTCTGTSPGHLHRNLLYLRNLARNLVLLFWAKDPMAKCCCWGKKMKKKKKKHAAWGCGTTKSSLRALRAPKATAVSMAVNPPGRLYGSAPAAWVKVKTQR